MPVTFRCPRCGTRIEVDAADVGEFVECGECRATVQVPDRPAEPEEGEGGPRVELTAAEAALADRGLALLQGSLLLYLLGQVIQTLISAVRASVDGLDKVLKGEGDTVWLGIAATAFGVILGLVTGLMRIVGYRRCVPVGRVIGSDSVLKLAAFGVGLVLVLLVPVSIPGLVGLKPQDLPPAISALVSLGGMGMLVGMGLEFAACAFYYRLLRELFGRLEARRVIIYLVALGASVVLGIVGACVVGIVIAMAMAAQGGPRQPRQPGQFELSDLPQEALVATGVLAAVGIILGLILCWLYYRILARARTGLIPFVAAKESAP